MKKAAAVVLAVAAAAVAVGMYYCRPTQTISTRSRPAPVRPTTTAQGPSPMAAATSYIEALEQRKYETAWALLSKDSQEKHPYKDFVAQVEKTGVTEYDLSTARLAEGGNDEQQATVELQLKEDPAIAGFHMAREDGAWRIVYSEGSPSFPYP